jgi:hypothetical protein
VFKHRVLRRISGLKRIKIIGSWRKLHKQRFHNMYVSPSVIKMITSRKIGCDRACSRHEENMNVYRILVEKLEGKRPLKKSKCRWEDDIKMDFREIGWSGMEWIDLTQNRDYWRDLLKILLGNS